MKLNIHEKRPKENVVVFISNEKEGLNLIIITEE